jgi:hypothetical protein
MGELLSIREIVKRFGKEPSVYTVEQRPPKKPPQTAKPKPEVAKPKGVGHSSV